MTVMSEEELEAGNEVILQGVACDGTDMETITDTGYGVFIKLRPLYL